MIKSISYNGEKQKRDDIVKLYIESENSPLHIFQYRLKRWIEEQEQQGKLEIQRARLSTEQFLERHAKDIQKRARNRAIGIFAANHTGKKNKELRKQYPLTAQFKKDYEENLAVAKQEYLEGYERELDEDERHELDNWIGNNSPYMKQYNEEHAEEYLKNLNVSAIYSLCTKSVRDTIQKKIKEYLSTEKLYYNKSMDNYWDDLNEYVRLSPEYLDDFLYYFESYKLEELSNEIPDMIYEEFSFRSGICNEDICNDDDPVSVEIKDALDSMIDEDMEYPSDMVDTEQMKLYIEQNPYYQEMKRQQEEKERKQNQLKENILSVMPETYPELFPLARNMKRHFVLHIGPTNSGKTYAAMERLKEKGSGIYLAPLRLLAYEQYESLNDSGFACSLITGEERSIKDNACIQSSTVEIFDSTKDYDCVVLDETQMIEDSSRGWAWTAVILGICSPEIHVCMAPQARDIIVQLISECNDTFEEIRHERKTPLIIDKKPVMFPRDVEPGDALIVFSKRNVHAVAHELKEKGIKASIIYGNLPYDVRQNEAVKFQNGETTVLVSTDAIGMGLNLPIKRVLFLESAKYDGSQNRTLTAEEFKQIGGRAGRMGIFAEGHCAIYGSPKLLKGKMTEQMPAIANAVIGFPEQLTGLDGSLSDIIKQWDNLPVSKLYKHADSSLILKLAVELEFYTQDKELIYKFITIPFNEKTEVKNLWMEYFFAEVDNKYVSFSRVCSKYRISAESDVLADLEHFHKFCDLAYAYCCKFAHEEDIPMILDMKKKISEKIILLLSEQKLEARRCKYCNREIPWNYPYGMCEACHSRRFPRRTYYGLDDYDDFI